MKFLASGTSRLVLGFAVACTAFLTFAAVAHAADLANPLDPSLSTIPAFIAGALKVMVMIALPLIVLFIVYAGFKFIAAQGNEGKLSEAKKNFFYVIIGAILILGAWVIAVLIAGTVAQLTGGSGNTGGGL